MTLYEAHRDIIPEHVNFSKEHISDQTWDWALRSEKGMYNQTAMRGGALICGFVHGALFQNLLFQWTPSMCRFSRCLVIYLFVTPRRFGDNQSVMI